MRTIHKYPLELTDAQEVLMPKHALILSVQKQMDRLCLWAEVDTRYEHRPRTIEIIGTGNQISMVDNRVFIGTVQWDQFVWHIYERTTNNASKAS